MTMTRETRDRCAPLRLRLSVSMLRWTVPLWTLVVACGGTERNKHHDGASDSTVSTSAGGSGAATSAGGVGGTAGEAGSPPTDTTSSGATGGVGGNGGSAASGTNATTSATGGSNSGGGTAGAGPVGEVTSVPLAGGETEQVDLLFVVDNSISMADKQELFQTGVPTLVERLINPVCVSLADPDDVALVAAPSTACPSGFEREFEPLTDVHVGIISTSLGAHGGSVCSPEESSWNESKNDRGRLLPSVRPDSDLASYQDLGFLAWDPGSSKNPPGETDVGELVTAFQSHVMAAGEVGCGYEAPLESWYRFLVDPAPPLDIVREDNVARPATDENGDIIVDDVVLAQRAAFLRPDSVVAIIMLTDENDCSVVDSGMGFLTSLQALNGGAWTMPAVTAACEGDPNDPCCRSCALGEGLPPAGCEALSADPGCLAGRPANSDALNLRCYNQKQRFGFDLLYPVERYIDALSVQTLVDRTNCGADSCAVVPNPLFVQGNYIRSPSRVVLTGIVGVPWQDLATPESLTGSRLEYMTPEELEESGRWQVILGDPEERVPPTDPLMIETPEPRSGTHPITGDALAPETSTNPLENPINGHEFVNARQDDLQYACTFPLQTPRVCSDDDSSCDCRYEDVDLNRPLCNPPAGGAAGTTQYFGKAYPAPRLLQVIQGLGSRGMPASICPRTTSGSPADAGFGYNPAVDAVIRRVEAGLGASCVSELEADVTNTLGCRVLEVGKTGCACDGPGRRELPADIQDAVQAELLALCTERGDACADYCACEIEPLTGDAMTECMTEVSPAFGDGWCYISPSQGIGAEELVEHCPAGARRSVRVVGAAAELSGTELRLLCD